MLNSSGLKRYRTIIGAIWFVGIAANYARAEVLTVWLFSDPHVCNRSGKEAPDRRWCDAARGIRSLERGILQSKRFGWDFALGLGDFGTWPSDEEGREVVAQFAALDWRESVYTLAGNHDADPPHGDYAMPWFRRYVDPLGENTAVSGVNRSRFPYPVHGTWERYYFDVGNIRFVMMSDRNDGEPPVGRGKEKGGYPAGAITQDTFQWLGNLIAANEALAEPRILILAHHHMLENTTAGSIQWGGFTRFRAPLPNFRDENNVITQFHGFNPDISIRGASFLYFIGRHYGGNRLPDLMQSCKSCALWLGGHTHLPSPDFDMLGMGPVANAYGMTFANISALTSYWQGFQPMSRLLTIRSGSRYADLRYVLHSDSGALLAQRTDRIDLKQPFRPGLFVE